MSADAAALVSPPLPTEQLAQLALLAAQLDSAQLQWASGYLFGRTEQANGTREFPADLSSSETLTITYGSQTGNSRQLAEQLASQAEAEGLGVRLVSMADLRARDLVKTRLLYAVISTQGDGDPPDDARRFLDELGGRRAPQLDGLRFAVLALGDSSYPLFCATGRSLDQRLAELGGQRVVDRVDADLAFERDAAPWLQSALAQAGEILNPRGERPPQLHLVSALPKVELAALASRKPFKTEVIARQQLTTERAVRQVHHVELDISGSGIDYQPGDALAIVPVNHPRTVDEVLAATGFDGNQVITLDGDSAPLSDWLLHRRELTRLSLRFLRQQVVRGDSDSELARALGDEDSSVIRSWIANRQLNDVLREAPADWQPEALLAALPPLATRAYSIASSRQNVGDDEVHLCVAEFDGAHAGNRWRGVTSRMLSSFTEGDHLDVLLEANPRFRLPTDAATDILMIGAGSGVAPYRGFLQQRVAVGASGRNWLLFGNRQVREDFLYQAEWLQALQRGQLHRLDVAFSRDSDDSAPRYVQDRLRREGRRVYDWIESGASLYLCGDASRMAPGVDAALADIIATHAAIDAEAARERLNALAAERRYLRDVY